MRPVGDTTSKRTTPTYRRMRGILPRMLVVGSIVTFTAACSSEGTRTAIGSSSRSAPRTSLGTSSSVTSVPGSPPVAKATDPAPGAGATSSSVPALLTLPRVGGDQTTVPSVVLVTGSGQSTGAPLPPPNTVSLEDLYRQGQVDVSR